MKYGYTTVASFFLFFLSVPIQAKSVEERDMGLQNISSKECLEVLEMGNVLNISGENYYRIILRGHSYIVTVKYMGATKHYSCDSKMKLITN